jgi:oxygen-dependent protoporphyrinogen oxidase
MVVNLYYSSPSVLPVSGFGYLIPRSLPYDQNPELALGVIFDSETTRGQDVLSAEAAARGGAIGTKVTVMLGGHYWDGWDHSILPSEEEAILMAQRLLARHLKVTEIPETARAALQKDCIPQYMLGHHTTLNLLHEELQEFFMGRLAVAGNWTKGVGVNDCIIGAERVADLVVKGGGTGLEWTENGMS